MPKAENVSTGLKTKFQMTNFLDLKAKKRLGNHCKNKTGATKEIKWLRKLREKFSLRETSGKEKVDWEEPKPFIGKNPSKEKGGRQKRKQPDSKLNPSYQRHPRKKANSIDLTGNWRKNKVSGSLLLTKDLKSTGEQESSPYDRLPGD